MHKFNLLFRGIRVSRIEVLTLGMETIKYDTTYVIMTQLSQFSKPYCLAKPCEWFDLSYITK